MTNEILGGFGRVIEQWLKNSKLYETVRKDLAACLDFTKEVCF